MPRWGAERRARPLHFLRSKAASVLPQWEDRRKGARRIACRCGSGWCASRRSASLLLREEFLGDAFWLGFSLRFLGVGKTRVRRGIATTDRTHVAKGHFSKDIRAFQRTSGYGAATTHAKLSGAAHARRVAGAPIARAQRFGPARAVRFAGIVPLLRQQAVPPAAHMLRRRPGGVRLEALVPQEGQAQDAAERMEPARAPQVVVTPAAAKPAPPRPLRRGVRSGISGWFNNFFAAVAR